MFTKVRPFQKQYYKYAHAKNYNDLFATNRRYLEDVTYDGVFEWTLESLTSANGAFNKSRGTSVGISPTIRIFRCYTPNVTDVSNMFSGLNSLEFIEMNFDKVTGNMGWFVADGCDKLRKYPDNLYTADYKLNQALKGTHQVIDAEQDEDGRFIIPYHDFINSCTQLISIWVGTWRRGDQYWHKIKPDDRYTFENVVYGGSLFNNQWPYMGVGAELPKNLNLQNLTEADGFCNGSGLYRFDDKSTLSNLTVATGFITPNNYTEYGMEFLSHFKPNHELDLGKLSSAANMFASCKLRRESVVRILRALPVWNDGKSHALTMGCYIDLKTEAETEGTELYNLIQDAIGTPTYDSEGNHLSGKGWTITFQWNGNSGGVEPSIELVELPEGYTQLAYLETYTMGRQPPPPFIDTKYVPTENTGLWVKAKQVYGQSGRQAMGCGISSNNNEFCVPTWSKVTNEKAKCGWKTTKNWDVTCSGGYFESSLNWLNSRTANIKLADDTEHTMELGELGFTPTLPIWILGNNNTGTGSLQKTWNGRIYRAKISEGDQIVRDFVPVLDSENQACMYELIEGKAYYNEYHPSYTMRFDFIAPSQIGLEPQVASYSLRRTVEPIYAKVVDDTYGMYKRRNGSRCNIEHANSILGGDWEEMGYEICYSIEEIEEKYNLHKLTPEEAAKLIPKS